jgi:hypothetical protein
MQAGLSGEVQRVAAGLTKSVTLIRRVPFGQQRRGETTEGRFQRRAEWVPDFPRQDWIDAAGS